MIDEMSDEVTAQLKAEHGDDIRQRLSQRAFVVGQVLAYIRQTEKLGRPITIHGGCIYLMVFL